MRFWSPMSSAVSAATRKLAASLPRSTAATCPKWRITTWPYLRAFEREALKSGHAVHSLHEPCPRTTADNPGRSRPRPPARGPACGTSADRLPAIASQPRDSAPFGVHPPPALTVEVVTQQATPLVPTTSEPTPASVRGLPDRRLPPVILLPHRRLPMRRGGQRSGSGSCRRRSRAMMHSAARLPTPVIVSSRSRAWLNGTITRSTSTSSVLIARSR